MIRYLNSKTEYSLETIDQLDSKDFKSYSEFKKELHKLQGEYAICQIPCYISQKSCKN